MAVVPGFHCLEWAPSLQSMWRRVHPGPQVRQEGRWSCTGLCGLHSPEGSPLMKAQQDKQRDSHQSSHRVPLGSVTQVFSFVVNILPCFLLTKRIAAMEMQLKKTTVRARFTKEGKIACKHNPQMAVIGVVNFAVNLKRLRCFLNTCLI